MSGIVGSSHNIRGSGVVSKLGTDGQVFTSAGAGVKQTYEAAGGGKLVDFAFSNNGAETTINSTSLTSTGLSVSHTPTDYSNNKIIVQLFGFYHQDDATNEDGYFQIQCTGQHTTNFSEILCGVDTATAGTPNCLSFYQEDGSLVNNSGAETYTLYVRTTNALSDWRPHADLTLCVSEIS
jgi:hypothetical protein